MSGNLALVVDQRGCSLEKGSQNTLVLRHADGQLARKVAALGFR